jgi:hypothetical protein
MPSNKLFNLSIIANGSSWRFANILIYNGYNELVAKEYGRITKSLPMGLYRVSVEMNETITEKMIRLDKDVIETIEIPVTASSVLGSKFSTSHEYYSDNAVEWSKKPTAKKLTAKSVSSIFLFLRYTDIKSKNSVTKKESLGQNFHILNKNREKVYTLDAKNVKQDKRYGWLTFHAAVPQGQYYLLYMGKIQREIPLYAFPQWQTQIFLTYNALPVFGSLKILIGNPKKGFDPNDEKIYQIDAILQKLYNGIYYLPDAVLTDLAYGKWENPMAGILGAYMYLNSDKTDKDNLFKMVMKNLETKILKDCDAPDLIALKILYALHLKKAYKGLPLTQPCMLLSGMKAAIKASSQNPAVIQSGEIAESTIVNLYSDIVWTSYKPMPVANLTEVIKKKASANKKVISKRAVPKKVSLSKQAAIYTLPKKQKTDSVVLKSWVTGAVINYLQSNNSKDITVNISKLAEQLQVTPSIVSNVISNLDGYIKKQAPDKKTSAVSVVQGLLAEGKKLDFKSLANEKNISNMINFVSKFTSAKKKEEETF